MTTTTTTTSPRPSPPEGEREKIIGRLALVRDLKAGRSTLVGGRFVDRDRCIIKTGEHAHEERAAGEYEVLELCEA
jgi:hypothetical protein